MVGMTLVDRACTRAGGEQESVDARHEAYGTFVSRVTELRTDSARPTTAGIATAGGTRFSADSSADDPCQTVRTAFAETVSPHSVADTEGSEPLLETIREEFTEAIAVALAPASEASFTPGLKRLVLAEAQSRQSETAALRRALDREATRLDEAREVVGEITTWLAEADATPLTDLGFDALARRHERLANHRHRCEELARRRQEFLGRTTNEAVEAGVRHRSVVASLYQDFPVDHPVLATVASLDDTCEDCQRVVRTHLGRRV